MRLNPQSKTINVHDNKFNNQTRDFPSGKRKHYENLDVYKKSESI
jgi:hypothetical protein